jgi:hypothetical protein
MKNRGLIMNNDMFVKKFKYVMYQMFPDTNQDFTFNNFDRYINSHELDEIGIYVIKPKKGYALEVIDYPGGPTEYKGKKISEIKKYKNIKASSTKLKKSDKEILYIGATPSKNNTETLKGRLTKYRNFGYGYQEDNNHSGGKRIWFIKNNKDNLVIDYMNINLLQQRFPMLCQEAENIKNKYPHEDNLTGYIEDGLLYLHKFAYERYPFANERCDYKETENAWLCFWTNYKIN